MHQVLVLAVSPMRMFQGVTSPLAGQMFFRASMFSAFGAAKRYLGTNPDGSTRSLKFADFYKVKTAMHSL